MPTKLQLSFTKITFPPTPTAWTHTYTAGSFFAVASLASPVPPEETDLNALGKGIFTNLETEFFTLEKKDLTSIKQVIATSLTHLPDTVALSFNAAYIKDTLLYVFIAGSGNILLKRGLMLAPLLSMNGTDRTIKAASGIIHVNDLLFLETQACHRYIAEEQILQESDRLPNEIADSFINKLQSADNNAAGCIIVKVEGILQQDETKNYAAYSRAICSTGR